MPFKPTTYQEAKEKLEARQKRSKLTSKRSLEQKRVSTTSKKKVPLKRKIKDKTVTYYKKKLWEYIKQAIRTKYAPDGIHKCFTCDKVCNPAHTGHIITSSLCSMYMRYNLDNLRLQCYSCNIHKSGNWVEFKKRLGDDYINNLIKQNDETKGGDYGMWWVKKEIEKYN